MLPVSSYFSLVSHKLYDTRALFCNEETHALSFYVIFICLSQMCDIALNTSCNKEVPHT